MRKTLLFILFALLLSSGSFAQRRIGLIGNRRLPIEESLFLSAGPAYCFGDTKGNYWDQWHNPVLGDEFHNFDISAGYRRTYRDLLGYRAQYKFGYKLAFDYSNLAASETGFYHRNYTYRSNLFEVDGQAEFSLSLGKRFRWVKPHILYGGLGLGVFGVTAKHSNAIQSGSYKFVPDPGMFVSPIIPLTLGYRYRLNNDFDFGAEYKWKFSLSDYIDGFFPTKGSRSNDFIQGLSLVIVYKL